MFLTHPLFIAAAVSFAIGALGYLIFYFWIIPIGKYRMLKIAVRKDIDAYKGAIEKKEAVDKKINTAIRKNAAGLSESHSNDLPPWYRVLLAHKKESPRDASALLMKLANTRNPGHSIKQIEKIKQTLRL